MVTKNAGAKLCPVSILPEAHQGAMARLLSSEKNASKITLMHFAELSAGLTFCDFRIF